MIHLREFTPDEVTDLVRLWLDAFGKDRRGIDSKNDYLWHVFSYRRYPALEGAPAREEYGRQVCREFVVLSEDGDTAYLTDSRPLDLPCDDFYVFPPNLAWTMVFTHEEGYLGPYFARHPRYGELNAANAAQVRKREEIERARTRGWLGES